jgi:predicted nucleic acid-binding protein
VLDEAAAGRIQVWTSALSLAEVFKVKCGGETATLPADKDPVFGDFLSKEYIVRVSVTVEIATFARTLLRQCIKKPNDAIHVATAALLNLDELHTYDEKDILPLNGMIKRADGELLKIMRPPEPPPGTKMPLLEAKKADAAS